MTYEKGYMSIRLPYEILDRIRDEAFKAEKSIQCILRQKVYAYYKWPDKCEISGRHPSTQNCKDNRLGVAWPMDIFAKINTIAVERGWNVVDVIKFALIETYNLPVHVLAASSYRSKKGG